MPRYLLDTNAVSDLINDPGGRVARAIERIGEPSICTSIIVAAEVRFGAAKGKSRRLMRQIETALTHLDIRPFAAPADRVYGELRADLERKGRPIGPNDLLIAAHALALSCILVTNNEREFSRIKVAAAGELDLSGRGDRQHRTDGTPSSYAAGGRRFGSAVRSGRM